MSGLVVPITAVDRAKAPSRPPPDEPWALMAAAQMQAEGRLELPRGDKRDIPDARPLRMFGGRSVIEANNPNLGPEPAELERRKDEMDRRR
jgi:hypothetical protein